MCSFREKFAALKLKYALWFPTAIGNMQFPWHGRWAHPYPGISLTFWQYRDVVPLEQNVSSVNPHWSPDKLRCYECLFVWSLNPRELSAYLRIFHVIHRACPTPHAVQRTVPGWSLVSHARSTTSIQEVDIIIQGHRQVGAWGCWHFYVKRIAHTAQRTTAYDSRVGGAGLADLAIAGPM